MRTEDFGVYRRLETLHEADDGVAEADVEWRGLDAAKTALAGVRHGADTHGHDQLVEEAKVYVDAEAKEWAVRADGGLALNGRGTVRTRKLSAS